MEELRGIAFDLSPDFICVTETWTNSDHTDSYLSIKAYNIICRHDRKDTNAGTGGGLLIYAKDSLCVPESFQPVYELFNQCCSIKIPVNGRQNLELVLVYRPHRLYNSSVDVCENNSQLCNVINSVPKPCIILGDFNFSDISWELLSGDAHSKQFLETIQSAFFTQHVDFPTRLESNTMPDLVLSSHKNQIINVSDVGKLGKSDHSLLMIKIDGCLSSNVSIEEVPDWKRADMSKLRDELHKVDWNELKCLSVDDMWIKFKEIVTAAQEACVPMKKRRTNNRPIWMTRSILRIIRKKRRLWKVYKDTKDYQEYLSYKSVEKTVQKSVRRAKQKFERNLAKNAKKNPKSFYSYLRTKTSNKETVGPLKDGNEFTTDDEKMANILNNFFSSVFTTENMSNLPSPMTTCTGTPLTNTNIEQEKIEAKITKLNSSSSPGPDKLCPRLLQGISDIISIPLAIIYRKSLDEGVVPQEWKRAHVTPIFKKGDKSSAGNYRPISLTCILCKIMESLIRDAIIQHLTSNNIILPSQHGFMQRKSCMTNLLEYLEVLTKLVDEGHSIDVVYLDFAKAFDKVPHQRLLAKLKAAGIDGCIVNWVEAWLKDRKQRVILNGKSSEWRSVDSGVPQGSVLGPTLFIVYINDIDNAVDTVFSILSKFADDTKVIRIVENDVDRAGLQADLENLLSWSEEWQMMFNAGKCKVLHFGKKNPRYCYTIGGYAPAGTVLEHVQEEKDLGVIIHESLKPTAQCAKAAKKANQVLGQMSRAITYRDRYTWVSLYKQYVRSHLEYAIQAWCPWTESDIDMLEGVQKRAIRMVSGLQGKTYEERLREVGLTTLLDRRKRGDMIEVWKIMNNKEDVKYNTWFTLASDRTVQPTRHSSSTHFISKPKFNTDIRKNFFSVRSVDPWNNLPQNVYDVSTLNMFKNEYDSLFTS